MRLICFIVCIIRKQNPCLTAGPACAGDSVVLFLALVIFVGYPTSHLAQTFEALFVRDRPLATVHSIFAIALAFGCSLNCSQHRSPSPFQRHESLPSSGVRPSPLTSVLSSVLPPLSLLVPLAMPAASSVRTCASHSSKQACSRSSVWLA